MLKNISHQKWYRWGKYEIKDGYILPVPHEGERPKRYDPFEYYYPPNKSQKDRKSSLFLRFANIDEESNESILRFVSEFGLLGLAQFTVKETSVFLPPSLYTQHDELHDQIFVLCRSNPELVPINDFCNDFRIPYNPDSEMIPNYEIKLAGEPLNKFKNEVVNFRKNYKEIYRSIKELDYNKLQNYFNQRHNTTIEDDRLMDYAGFSISFGIDDYLEGLRPILFYDNNEFHIKWKIPCLLSAIYLMLVQTMTSNYYIRQCKKDSCRQFFATNIENQMFCETKHENAYNQWLGRQAVKLFKEGKSIKEIASQLNVDEDRVAIWTSNLKGVKK